MFPGYNHFNPGHYQPQQSTYQQTYSLANDPATIPPPSSIQLPGPNPNSTAFQQPQERRNGRDTLLSMRKYRSLDGGQFLGHLDPFGGTSTAYIHDHSSLPAEYMNIFQQNQGVLPTRQSTSTNFDNSQLLLTRAPGPAPTSTIYQQQLTSMANYPTTFHPQMTLNTTTTSLAGGGEYRGGIGGGCNNNPTQMPFVDINNYGMYGNLTASSRRIENNDDDPLTNAWLYYQPISAQSILQQIDFDPRALRREFCSLCDRYNYLAATVRSFWAPELQRERQKRKEEAIRADQMEQRLSQKNSETQILRVELDRRREDEDSGIGRPLSHPRDFTDHTITLHEWQTLKTKLERSELSLAERTRELQSAELRAKCAEEQKEEVERRSEILSKSNCLNEAQLKLLHEDLNVLRGKLELKNQQLEMREKANKKAEAEMDSLRMELKESQQNAQDAERRIAQLTHRIDQMEREMREQNSQMEMLKQRLLQQPSTKAEMEFQQKLENALEDRRKLEQLIDQLRQQNETERQQQLQQFMQERDQLQANIAYLKKELADRHVLISSQSEKICQLDNAVKNATANQFDEKDESKALEKEGTATTLAGGSGTFQQAENTSMEMERLHREVDRLLKRVQQLDREKAELMAMAAKKDGGQNIVGAASSLLFATDSGIEMTMDERVNSLRQRIRDLEEALRESVECTAEKEKSLSEQKRLVEKLSNQVNELFESSGSAAAITSQQRQTRDALAHLADAQKQLEEERQQRQRQVSTVRKELGMALVAEKEAAISLVQHSCPMVEAIPGLREKLDALQRQKEALKHALLMSTAGEDPSTNFGLQIGGNSNTTAVFGNATSRLDPSVLRSPAMVQPGRPMSAAAALLPSSYAHSLQPQQQSASSAIGPAPALSHPIRIQTAGYGSGAFGISAPASLNLYTPTGFDDFGPHQADEEGIWA